MTARRAVTVLGLDLGTSCGWAVHRLGDPVLGIVDGGPARCLGVGTWELAPPRGAPPAWRYARLREYLAAVLERGVVTHLAFESVMGRPAKSGVEAGHVYGGLRAVAWLAAFDADVPVLGVSVQAVKRLATGAGGGPAAGKEQVTAAAVRELGRVVGPDAADAWFVARAAAVELSAGPAPLRPVKVRSRVKGG